jgi:hypothetical protein
MTRQILDTETVLKSKTEDTDILELITKYKFISIFLEHFIIMAVITSNSQILIK